MPEKGGFSPFPPAFQISALYVIFIQKFFQTGCGKPGAEPGEKSRENGTDHHQREINQDSRLSYQKNGDDQLPDVVCNSSEYAGDENILFMKQAVDQCHGDKAQKASAQAVHERHELSGTDTAQQNADKQYKKSIPFIKTYK